MLERAAPVLTAVAAAVLVGLALRTLWAAVRRYRTAAPTTVRADRAAAPGRAYLTLVGLTAVNPATVLTFSAVVLGRPAGGGLTWLGVALFAAGALGASAAWQLLLVSGGSVLGRVLAGRRGQLAVAGTSAALMLGLAVAIALG